jgi:hypothetical protein
VGLGRGQQHAGPLVVEPGPSHQAGLVDDRPTGQRRQRRLGQRRQLGARQLAHHRVHHRPGHRQQVVADAEQAAGAGGGDVERRTTQAGGLGPADAAAGQGHHRQGGAARRWQGAHGPAGVVVDVAGIEPGHLGPAWRAGGAGGAAQGGDGFEQATRARGHRLAPGGRRRRAAQVADEHVEGLVIERPEHQGRHVGQRWRRVVVDHDHDHAGAGAGRERGRGRPGGAGLVHHQHGRDTPPGDGLDVDRPGQRGGAVDVAHAQLGRVAQEAWRRIGGQALELEAPGHLVGEGPAAGARAGQDPDHLVGPQRGQGRLERERVDQPDRRGVARVGEPGAGVAGQGAVELGQLGQDHLGAGRPPGWIDGEQAADQLGQAALDVGRERRCTTADRPDQLTDGVGRERSLAARGQVQHRAEPVQIAAGVGVAEQRLGREVGQGAADLAGAGRVDQPEVDEVAAAARIDQHVAGADVAVHQPGAVQRRQCAGEVGRELGQPAGLVTIVGAAARSVQPGAQVEAVDPVDHEVRRAGAEPRDVGAGEARLEDDRQRRMVDPRQRGELGGDPLPSIRPGAGDLDGDTPGGFEPVVALEDHTLPTTADVVVDLEAPDRGVGRPDLGRRGRHRVRVCQHTWHPVQPS